MQVNTRISLSTNIDISTKIEPPLRHVAGEHVDFTNIDIREQVNLPTYRK